MLTDSQDRANTISQHPHRWHQQNPVGYRTYRLYEGGHGKYGGYREVECTHTGEAGYDQDTL